MLEEAVLLRHPEEAVLLSLGMLATRIRHQGKDPTGEGKRHNTLTEVRA